MGVRCGCCHQLQGRGGGGCGPGGLEQGWQTLENSSSGAPASLTALALAFFFFKLLTIHTGLFL